ncbi:MAG: peroxiredoxin family protein [Blastocatellales bacterium]
MIKNLKMQFVISMAATIVILAVVWAQNPQISLRSTDGRNVSSSDLKGKIVVLSFGGTWVPMVSKELPALQKLADRYSTRGVQVYWVSINSDKQGTRTYATDNDLQAFAQKNNVRLTILRDPEQQAYKAYGLDALPTLLILDRDGKVVRKHVGFGTDQGEGYGEIIRDLDQLLK